MVSSQPDIVPFIASELGKGFVHRLQYREFDKPEDWSVRPHFHEHYEVVVYQEIAGTIGVNGQEFEIGGGMMLYVPPYVMHRFDVLGGSNAYSLIHWTDRSENLPIDDFPAEPLLFPVSQEILDIVRPIVSGYELLSDDTYATTKQELVRSMLSLACETIENTPEAEHIRGSRFSDLLRYLQLNGIYQMNAERAAELCGLSRSHFIAAFKKQFLITFQEFLVERKVEVAKRLLVTTEMKGAQIATKLDFDDPSYFVKVFKKRTGDTPRVFRTKYKADA